MTSKPSQAGRIQSVYHIAISYLVYILLSLITIEKSLGYTKTESFKKRVVTKIFEQFFLLQVPIWGLSDNLARRYMHIGS